MTRKNKFVLTIETDRASDIARLLRQQAEHLDKYPLNDMPLRSYESVGGGVDSEVTVELNAHLVE